VAAQARFGILKNILKAGVIALNRADGENSDGFGSTGFDSGRLPGSAVVRISRWGRDTHYTKNGLDVC
jgi:hypothetical protein